MSPARLLRLAGLLSVAAGVLLVVTQLLFSLTLVVADGDPLRRARSPLVGVDGLLTLLAVYLLLLGLVGLYARQAAVSGTLGLVGFLVAVLGTMLLAGAWWLGAFAVPWAVLKAPALVAATPTGRLLAGRSVVAAAANRRDDGLLAATLDTMAVVGVLPARPVVHLDAGYDWKPCRQALAARGMLGEIATRGMPAPIQASRRWPVERTHAWGNQYGKLRWCTERRRLVVEFWLALANAAFSGADLPMT
jgi:hypothetical protein